MDYSNYMNISLRVKPTGRVIKSGNKTQYEVTGNKTIYGITNSVVYKAHGFIRIN